MIVCLLTVVDIREWAVLCSNYSMAEWFLDECCVCLNERVCRVVVCGTVQNVKCSVIISLFLLSYLIAMLTLSASCRVKSEITFSIQCIFYHDSEKTCIVLVRVRWHFWK